MNVRCYLMNDIDVIRHYIPSICNNSRWVDGRLQRPIYRERIDKLAGYLSASLSKKLARTLLYNAINHEPH